MSRSDAPAPALATDGATDMVYPSFASRAAMVFAAPRRLFASFRPDAPFVDALAVSTLVAVVTILAMPDEAFMIAPEDALNRRGAPVEITSSPAEIARFGRYLGMMGTAVAHPILALGITGALTLVFTVLGGGRGSFRQFLAVISHALLISALGLLVAALLGLLWPGAERWLSAAPLLPATGIPAWLLAVVAALNAFTLWMLAVLSLGVSVVDGRRSWPVVALGVFALSIALVAVRSLLLA